MEAVGEQGELDLSRTRPVGEVEAGYTYMRDGDVTYAKITPCFENGKGAIMRGLVGGIAFGTTELTVLRPHPDFLDANFLQRILSSPTFRLPAEGAMYGAGGQKRVSDTFTRDFTLSLPPLPEQRAIAGFLDIEVGKIDALVEEQRRLIALLAEKRRAVISHAVTRGLNPAAPLKPSGVDWLGDIPAHWEVCRLKQDLNFLTSGSRGWAEHYADDGALFIRIGNLTRDSLNLRLDDIQRVDVPDGAEGERTSVQPGDVLFSITAFLGSVAVAPDDLELSYVSQHVALARLKRELVLPRWVGFVTLSEVGKNYLGARGYGGTKVQLSLDDVANLVLPVPPLDEQSAILAHLDAQTTRLDALSAEADRAVALLLERRAALISAAVTGKIDVRALES
jgi:type I restriction enzyme S subunit